MLLDRAYLGARQWSMPRWLLRSKIWSEYNFFILPVESTWCARTNSPACFLILFILRLGCQSEHYGLGWKRTKRRECSKQVREAVTARQSRPLSTQSSETSFAFMSRATLATMVIYFAYSAYCSLTEVSECAFTYKFSILGEPVLTTTTLAKWVNSELNLREEDGYSAACMKTWLHRCGFKVSKYRYTSNNWM